MAITPASSRQYTITPNDDGNFLDLGPAGSGGSVATFVAQFNPSPDFVGTIAVRGRPFGVAAAALNVPPLPIPYRRVNVNGAASDLAIVSDVITGAGLIQVPCSGMSLLFQVACGAGSCAVASWDLNGPSSP